MFADRTDAGRRLADQLAEQDVVPDLVTAIPRGGLPAGRVVADRFDVPLEVTVAKKLGAPGNTDVALGAVTSDGSVFRNDALIARLGVSEEYFEAERERKTNGAVEAVERYQTDASAPDLANATVALVDDGVATGATAIACLRQFRGTDVARVVLAVPVAPADAESKLSDEADEVVTVETPSNFGAVGTHYENFEQVTDEEAEAYLHSDS